MVYRDFYIPIHIQNYKIVLTFRMFNLNYTIVLENVKILNKIDKVDMCHNNRIQILNIMNVTQYYIY